MEIISQNIFEMMSSQINIDAEQKTVEKIFNETICPKAKLNELYPTDADRMWIGLYR